MFGFYYRNYIFMVVLSNFQISALRSVPRMWAESFAKRQMM